MDTVKWPAPEPQFSEASPAKKWQILPSKIDEMEMVESAQIENQEQANDEDYATKYASNTAAKPEPRAALTPAATRGKNLNASAAPEEDDDDDLPPPNIMKKGTGGALYEGGHKDQRHPQANRANQVNKYKTMDTHKDIPFLPAQNYFYDYGFGQQEEPTNATYGAPQDMSYAK